MLRGYCDLPRIYYVRSTDVLIVIYRNSPDYSILSLFPEPTPRPMNPLRINTASRHVIVAAVVSLVSSLVILSAQAMPAGKPQHLALPEQSPEGQSKSDWSSIRSANEGGLQARNPGQQWTTKSTSRFAPPPV